MVVNDTGTLPVHIETAVERHQSTAQNLPLKAKGSVQKINYTTLNQIRGNTCKPVRVELTPRAIPWLSRVEDSLALTAAGRQVPGPYSPMSYHPTQARSYPIRGGQS